MFHAPVSRRSFLRSATGGALGLGAVAVLGCGGNAKPGSTSTAAPPPTNAPAPPTAPTTASRTGAWTRVTPAGPAPSARRDHSLTFVPSTGLIYLFAGRAGGVSSNDVWTLDPAAARWAEVPVSGARPDVRFAHVATYDAPRDRLVIATGQGASGNFFNDVWALDLKTSVWQQLDAASDDHPEIRYGAGGAHDGARSRLLISHGFTDRGRFDDTWAFDLADDRWTRLTTQGEVPIKRCLTRSLWVPEPGELLLFGGQTDSNPFLGDFWALDEAAQKWNERRPMPLPGPRNLYGAALHAPSGSWFIFGGNTPGGPVSETWAYNVRDEAWASVDTSSGARPARRYSADVAFVGSRLYMFGGHDDTTELDDLWTLDLAV